MERIKPVEQLYNIAEDSIFEYLWYGEGKWNYDIRRFYRNPKKIREVIVLIKNFKKDGFLAEARELTVVLVHVMDELIESLPEGCDKKKAYRDVVLRSLKRWKLDRIVPKEADYIKSITDKYSL